VQPNAACVRVATPVLPGRPLQLPVDLHVTGVEVDERPPQPERFPLPQPAREPDRPSSPVPPVLSDREHGPRLGHGQAVLLLLVDTRRVDELGDVAAHDLASPGDLQRSGEHPVHLQD
jgi:hypothetical protein